MLGLGDLPLMLAKHTSKRLNGMNNHWNLFIEDMKRLQRG